MSEASSWSRRGFLGTVASLGGVSAAEACWPRRRLFHWHRKPSPCPPCPPQPIPPDPPASIRVRQDVRDLSAQALASLARGVQVMKARSPSDRTSWWFQANIHGTLETPADPLWNQCTHSRSSVAMQFLTWHRGYLHFFERILRDASGDPTLNLPYWNWSEQLSLPAPFLDPGSSLFDASRNINGGEPIPATLTVDDLRLAMDRPDFGPVGFSPDLEGSPHGGVHVEVGGNMGSVPTAANDPIFWLHHANVDRVWNMWLNLGGGRENPSDDAFLNEPFQFVDETGAVQSVTARDVIDSGALQYRYDDVPNPPVVRRSVVAAPMAMTEAAVEQEAVIVAAPRGAEVPPERAPEPGARHQAPHGTEGAEAVELPAGNPLGLKPERIVMEALPERVAAFQAAEAAAPREERLFVEVQGIQLQEAPDLTYGVYLNLPEGVTDSRQARPYFLGSLRLFGRGTREAARHADHGAEAAVGGFDQTFDASRAIDRLRRENRWDQNAFSVTLLPLTPTPVPGREQELAARLQASIEEAGLTYRSVVLKARP